LPLAFPPVDGSSGLSSQEMSLLSLEQHLHF
jgi:hypothetical protein